MKAVITSEIAQNLHQVGDRWNLLILRDLFLGRNRFDQLQSHTGAGRATLSRRLQSLLDAEIIRKSPYSAGRHEYLLSDKGRDLFPAAMLAWRWEVTYLPLLAGELPPDLLHQGCGQPLRPRVACAACEVELVRSEVTLAAGARDFDQQVLTAQVANKQRRKRQAAGGRDESMARIAELVGDRIGVIDEVVFAQTVGDERVVQSLNDLREPRLLFALGFTLSDAGSRHEPRVGTFFDENQILLPQL